MMKNQNKIDTHIQGCSGLRAKQIRQITWIGLAVNLFISGLKFVVGTLGSSQAVIADAVHSLSDVITDIAILVGVRYWSSPADKCHPYGHRRIETMVTVGIAVTLAGAAFAIGYRGLSTMRNEDIQQPGWIAFIGAMLSIVIKEILYRWTVRVGQREKSSALIANAWHHRSDAFSSVPAAIAVAIAAVNPAWSFVDHFGAAIVSLFILHASWRIMKPALKELSDSSAPDHIHELINAAGMEINGVETIHALRSRLMGDGIYVDLHITVQGSMSVSRGHDVSEEVKSRIIERVPD
ncbi:MAG: cation diffusion facilitator family transporter, partial [Candidatus Latescibacterota bacterium]